MPTLDWIGKQAVIDHHREVPTRLLHCDSGLSAGDPDAGNLLVEGDNLEALKALLPYYAGQVKCIYIDPPYNTGSEDWIYNDNLSGPEIQEWLGKVVGKETEDLCRHDKWLCMMYPRLRLLRDFLTDDGAIFISIDDTEVGNLLQLGYEIFGRNNFIADLIWQKMDSPSSNQAVFSSYHDHTLVFARNVNNTKFRKLPKPEILTAYPLQIEGRRARMRQLRKNGKSARRADRETMWFPMEAAAENQVVGTWRMMSATIDPGGKNIPVYGGKPNGLLVLTPGMRFVEVLTDADMPRFASDARGEGTDDENRAAMSRSIGFFGTYTVDEKGEFSGNRVEGATFPNWVGSVRTRNDLRLVVAGDRMIESFRRPEGTEVRIEWRRAE